MAECVADTWFAHHASVRLVGSDFTGQGFPTVMDYGIRFTLKVSFPDFHF
jgi:hypothetical protein